MELLTARELCQTLKISKTTLYRLLQRGLPSLGEGKLRRFEWGPVLDWLSQGRHSAQIAPTLLRPGLYRCQKLSCSKVLNITEPFSEDYFYCPKCLERSLSWIGLPWKTDAHAK